LLHALLRQRKALAGAGDDDEHVPLQPTNAEKKAHVQQ